MRKVLTFIAKFIATILALLFVVTALLALLLANAGWHLLGPDLYKRALVEQRIYERLPRLVGEQVMHSLQYDPCAENPESEECLAEGKEEGGPPEEGQGGPPPFLQNLTPKDYEAILSDLAPPHWLREQAESVIDQLFAYLDFETQELSLTISLVEVKERLAGEEGMHAFELLVQTQPPCTEEQLDAFGDLDPESSPDTLIAGVPACCPPPEVLEENAPDIERGLDEVAAGIPDEADLTALMGDEGGKPGRATPPEDSGPLGDDPRPTLQFTRWAMRLSPLVPAVLLLLVTLFGVRSGRGWLRWWGIPLLIVGLIGGGLALAALPVMNWALATYAIPKIPGALAHELVEAGLDVTRYIAGTVVTWIGVEAGVVGLLGLVMVVVSLFLREEQTSVLIPEPVEEPQPTGGTTD